MASIKMMKAERRKAKSQRGDLTDEEEKEVDLVHLFKSLQEVPKRKPHFETSPDLSSHDYLLVPPGLQSLKELRHADEQRRLQAHGKFYRQPDPLLQAPRTSPPPKRLLPKHQEPKFLPSEVLHQQVKELKQKNFHMVQELERRNGELHELQKVLAEQTTDRAVEQTISEGFQSSSMGGAATGGTMGLGGSEDFRESKLLELAKKSRKLYVALEKERSKNTQLQSQIKHMELQVNLARSRSETAVKENTQEAVTAQTEAKQMRERVLGLMRRLEEERAQSHNLKLELKQTQKVLQMEVGEEVPIAQLIKDSGSWRGRAQQIAALKEKLNDLSRKFSQSQKLVTETADAGGSSRTGSASEISIPAHHRKWPQQSLRKNRDMLEKQMERYKAETEVATQKAESYRARNTILEQSVKDMRQKIASLIEKTTVDDQLIAALKHELTRGIHVIEGDAQDELDRKDAKIRELEWNVKRLSMSSVAASTTAPPTPAPHTFLPPLTHSQNSRVTSAASERTQMAAYQALKVRNEGLMALNRSLEQRLQECEADRNHLVKELKKVQRSPSPPQRRPDLPNTVEEMKIRIEVQEDEIEALKSSIRTLQRRKDEEVQRYQQMLDQTQQLLAPPSRGSNYA